MLEEEGGPSWSWTSRSGGLPVHGPAGALEVAQSPRGVGFRRLAIGERPRHHAAIVVLEREFPGPVAGAEARVDVVMAPACPPEPIGYQIRSRTRATFVCF